MIASIIIPFASYHEHLVQRAALSATQQTVRCEVIVIEDREGRGAGYARNQGISQASAPFCVFLDADDLLEPDFVEACVGAYQRGHYVYTDFFQDGAHELTSDCALWHNGFWHPVTTLFPTEAVRFIGGFDEDLPGGEDRDFYLKANQASLFGIRVPRPLMHYTGDGQRSKDWLFDPEYFKVRAEIDRRYIKMCSPECSGKMPVQTVMSNDKQDGDVLAIALYPPRREFGSGSGRIYSRPLYQGQEMWVDPRDVMKHPDLWRMKADPVAITPDVDTVLALVHATA